MGYYCYISVDRKDFNLIISSCIGDTSIAFITKKQKLTGLDQLQIFLCEPLEVLLNGRSQSWTSQQLQVDDDDDLLEEKRRENGLAAEKIAQIIRGIFSGIS
jgi:hypothetical protein